MKNIVKILCFLGLYGVGFYAIAQGNNFPQHVKMMGVVGISMQRICKIDNDSRQCEIFQVLNTEQGNSSSIIDGIVESKTRNESIRVIDERKEYLDFLESKNKINLTKMYSTLKNSQELICSIKLESKACDTALGVLLMQTDVEVGATPNPQPLLSIEVKKQIRTMIGEKYPKMNESGKLTIESMMTEELLKSK